MRRDGIDDRRRLSLLLVIMTGAAVAAAAITIWVLYRTAFDVQRERLVHLVESQARLIESVARFNADFKHKNRSRGANAAVLIQVVDAQKKFGGFGQTGEFTLARRSGDYIETLVTSRRPEDTKLGRVRIDGERAEPMRRALGGRSGTIEALDYRGRPVLAAYGPVAFVDWGLVAKMDLAEIRAPFLRAGGISAIGAVIVILFGTLIFRRVGSPIVEKLEATVSDLSHAERIAGLGNWVWERNGNVVRWSDQQFVLIGMDPGACEPTHQLFLDHTHPEDRELVESAVAAAIEHQHPLDIEFRIIGEDGIERICRARGEAVTGSGGKVIRLVGTAQDVTDRRRAENRSRSLFEAIEQFSDVFALYDSDDRMVQSNQRHRDLNSAVVGLTEPGVPYEEFIRGVVRAGLVPEAEGREDEWIRERLERHRNPGTPFEVQRQDGVWLLIKEQRMADGATILVATDIAEHKRVEEALRESRDLLEAVIDAIPAMVSAKDRDSRYKLINHYQAELYGSDKASAIGKTAGELLSQQYGDYAESLDRLVIEKGVPLSTFEETYADANGVDHTWLTTKVPLKNNDGEVSGVVSAALDISERKRMERDLAEQGERLATVLDNMEEGISMFDADLNLLVFNRRALELLDLPAGRFNVGDSFEKIIRYNAERDEYGTGDVDQLVHDRLELARRFEPHLFERSRPDGTVIEVRGRPTRQGGFVTIYSDISERKRAETALRESEQRFRALVDNAPQSIYLKDIHGRYILVNRNFQKHIGRSADDILGKTAFDFFPHASAQYSTDEDRNVLMTRRSKVFEADLAYPDGVERTVLVTKFPVLDVDGSPVALGGVTVNISDRKRAEEALQASEERHRRFAADVAHELRTPLAVLRSNLDNLDPIEEAESLRHDIDSMTRMVEQLLAATRLEILDIGPGDEADLRLVCTRVAELMAPLAIKEKRSIEIVGADTPVMVRGNADALEQAVRNLVENAIRYSPPQTTVTIDVGTDGTVRVIDHGEGIPPDARERVFERFQRADQRGGGAGLGLSIVQRTVEAHHGSIDIGEAPGGGTIFTMRLPAGRIDVPGPAAE